MGDLASTMKVEKRRAQVLAKVNEKDYIFRPNCGQGK